MIPNLPWPVIWRPKGFVPSIEELNSAHGVLAKSDVTSVADVPGDAHPNEDQLARQPNHSSPLPNGWGEGGRRPGEGDRGRNAQTAASGNSPPLSVVELVEGRIVGDLRLVVTHNGIAVGKLQSLIGSVDPGKHHLLRNPRFRLLRRLPGVALLLGIPESANYYHWLLNSAPRWKLLEAAGHTQAYDYVLLNASGPPFQDETLDRMRVPRDKRFRCSTRFLCQFERLVVPEMPLPMFKVPGWACNWVRSLFPERDPDAPKLLYVSRRAASRRRVANESMLEPQLQKLGFAIAQPERLAVVEQARLFSAAECIVAPHGAGLANLVFAPPGAHLVELFHPDATATFYRELAQVCGLRYTRL
ncbi:MAG: glycosyltransferase family 61 protein, partial [Verrucomicrobia bacterium]|nr:glycosyltransferase family 61 protein [Verrucomicrobiota bacterium]